MLRKTFVFLFCLVRDLLAISSSIAALIMLMYVIADHALPEKVLQNSVLNKYQSKVANFFAPNGYAVIPVNLSVIPKNVDFVLTLEKSALLTKEKKIPFSILRNDSGGIWTRINGEQVRMELGNQIKLPEINSYIWMYDRYDYYTRDPQRGWDDKTDKSKFYFQLREFQ